MDGTAAREIWARLVGGGSLADLRLPMFEGRVDLRGLAAPEPATVRELMVGNDRGNLLQLRGVRWEHLDLSDGALESLRFHGCQIENCRFDRAKCRDWRMWGTTIANTSFVRADLRQSALGGIATDGTTRNAFRRIDFSKADLRESAHISSDMLECTFAETKLSSVDFNGTVFVRCSFAGELKEVEFKDHAFRGEAFPPNRMDGVDLRQARLRFVSFRRLDMTNVAWPEDADHIVISDYMTTLDRLLGSLEGRTDLPARGVGALLGFKRKWAGPHQQIGVLNRRDLLEAAQQAEGLVDELLAAVPRVTRAAPPPGG
jgi:uncharacterized protein YjbI with pentapeptide repeats